jgi:hypothetical protein
MCALVGALLASFYGFWHDQITFTISPEYFTRLKFKQFQYAYPGFGDRAFVAVIGILATWWVGLFIGWCFGRRFVPRANQSSAGIKVRSAFVIVLACTVAFAIGGYVYGSFSGAANSDTWSPILDSYRVVDRQSFVNVAYIHNGSYLGGFVGLIAALLVVRPHNPS